MSSRLRVLFLTHRLPYAPNRGDRVRAYHMLRVLASDADVAIASLVHDAAEAAEVYRLDGLASDTIVAPVPRLVNHVRAAVALPSSRTLTGVLLHSPALRPALCRLVTERPFDVVLAFCSSMARLALEPPLDRFPLVIDMVDADSAKWQALATQTKWPRNWIYRREAYALGRLEARAMRRAYATVAVNAREVEHLKRLSPDARIEVLGNGVDLAALAPQSPPATSFRVVFCGVMNYRPNEAAAIWLARDVWPLVRQAFPAAELRIVGASPTSTVRALQDENKSIAVTGSVPDVRPELWAAAVATAPLHVSRGIQNKVLEAVAAGLPCVVTPAVREGLPDGVVPACVVADTAESFAAAIVALLRRTPPERRALANIDFAALSWERVLGPLLPLLREAANSSPAAVGGSSGHCGST